MSSQIPALPYPNKLTVQVFHDDGNWPTQWFMRPIHEIRELFRAKIVLAHYDGEEQPAYTVEQWRQKSEQLVAQYPDCIFVY